MPTCPTDSSWTGELEDRVGGLSARLGPLAEAGVDLEVVVARRQSQLPEQGNCLARASQGSQGTTGSSRGGCPSDDAKGAVVLAPKAPPQRPCLEARTNLNPDLPGAIHFNVHSPRARAAPIDNAGINRIVIG